MTRNGRSARGASATPLVTRPGRAAAALERASSVRAFGAAKGGDKAGAVVMEPTAVFWEYARFWLAIDVASSVPWDRLTFVGLGSASHGGSVQVEMAAVCRTRIWTLNHSDVTVGGSVVQVVHETRID